MHDHMPVHGRKASEHTNAMPLWRACKLQTYFTAKGLIDYFVVEEDPSLPTTGGALAGSGLIKHVDQKCAAFPLLHQSESPFSYPEFPLWKCGAFPSGPVNRDREMRRVSSTKARANHLDDRALRLQSV
ncbi:hypothetical protein FOXYSP1_19918 [Fusarium oxysporum f. sp. phaseoli]